MSKLLESLASINANLPGPSWPIVLFHTGDFDDKHEHTGLIAQVQIYIGERNRSFPFAKRIEFAKLDWKLPVGIPADKDIVDPIDSGRWPGKPAIDEVLLVAAR
jgi:mannosyltransferase